MEWSIPSIAFFEILISKSNMGNNIGKLKIAIKVELLPALAEIADTKVMTLEKPVAPKMSVIKK